MPKLPASAAVLLLIALGATACKKADAPADSGEGAAPAPATAATAAPAAAAPAAPAPTADAGAGDAETKYQCSTQVVPASYKPDSVTLKLKDKVLELKVDAANSSRYIGTDVEWWTNGRGPGATANLYARTPEGEAGAVLEGCTEKPKA